MVMPAKTIISDEQGQLVVDSASEYVITKTGKITVVDDVAILQQSPDDVLDLTINGKVRAKDGTGLYLANAEHNEITIGKSGLLTGHSGISGYAADSAVTNHGTISAQDYAIYMAGKDNVLTNTGEIHSKSMGVSLASGGGEIFNSGEITGKIAISIEGSAGDATLVHNTGAIRATGDAILGGAANDQVYTKGLIKGDVKLSYGDDTFTFAGGKVKGSVFGGEGDDIYSLSKPALKIVETIAEGTDSVHTAFSYKLGDNIENLYIENDKAAKGIGNILDNVLRGNGMGDNVLKGRGGYDILDGGYGNDVLIGGDRADTFVFGEDYGKDRITDFQAPGVEGHDLIDLTKNDAYSNFGEMAGHMKQAGDDVVINFGDGNRLTIENVEISELNQDHFMF